MTRSNIAPRPASISRVRTACRRVPQATRWQRAFLAAALLSAGTLLAPLGAKAQVNPEIANCSELKDEATITQAELCAAHVGCRFVLNVQKTCARAKGYIERLQAAIGEGTRTFFGGYRKEVTPDAVFTAALGDDNYEQARKLGSNSRAQQQAGEIGARVRDASSDTKTGRSLKGNDWIYYGRVTNDLRDGTGTMVFSSGEIQRGEFKADKLGGTAETLFADGSRYVGNYMDGKREGLHVWKSGKIETGTDWDTGTFIGDQLNVDGTQFKGRIDKGVRVKGQFLRADGSLAEDGTYENGKLSVGTRYDVAGVRTEVNLPAERQAAARAAADKARQEADAEQQRKRELAAQAEQQFRASLQTMNPGQLFARADELATQGDNARAREVQRALVSRFPDHPLAATAARKMAGEAGTGAASPGSTGVAPSGRPAGTRLSSQSCDAMKQTVIATKVPPNASITASQETVMFMTKTVLDMIDGGCATEPGVTPAQIEAERRLRQQQYAAAESACNAVQSGGRRCVAQVHAAQTATSRPAPAPAVNDASRPGSGTTSYDPVTGRCIGDPLVCACTPGIGSSTQTSACARSGGSSGGGIRTAR